MHIVVNIHLLIAIFIDVDYKEIAKITLFQFGGLLVINSDKLNVTESSFFYLMYGINSNNITEGTITSNIFQSSRVGAIDFGSSVLYCNNEFRTTEIGLNTSSTKSATLFDNGFYENDLSIRSDNSINTFYRNNNLENFSIGIDLYDSFAYLRNYLSSSNDEYLMYGRNKFLGIHFYNPNINPFADLGMADIFMRTSTSDISIECGYNNMSNALPVNLYKIPTAPLPLLPIGYNNWHTSNLQKIIAQNINIMGVQLNTSQIVAESCEYVDGDHSCDQSFIYSTCDDLPEYHNSGNWVSRRSDNSYFETVFTNAIDKLEDHYQSDRCRNQKIVDAHIAANYSSNPSFYLGTLKQSYQNIIINNSEPIDLRKSALRSLINIFLETEIIDSARYFSNQLLANYGNGIDSLYGKWNLLLCDVLERDSVQSIQYDSLCANWITTVIEDIRRKRDTLFLPGDTLIYPAKLSMFNPFENDELVKIDGIIPNPTDGYITIKFTLPEEMDISVSIVNSSGVEILKIVDFKKYSHGLHILYNDLSHLNSGLYFVKIVHNYGETTKPLLLVK